MASVSNSDFFHWKPSDSASVYILIEAAGFGFDPAMILSATLRPRFRGQRPGLQPSPGRRDGVDSVYTDLIMTHRPELRYGIPNHTGCPAFTHYRRLHSIDEDSA